MVFLSDPTSDEYQTGVVDRLVATGATLGVMAIVLVLFLFLLCIPWSKCRRIKRCFRNPRSADTDPVVAHQRAQEAQNNFFPLSILDLFPPSMLPKLPDYDECVREDDILPPATPPPGVITHNRAQTRVSVENRTEHSHSGGSVTGSQASTPPPYTSAIHSPAGSGEPVPPSSTSQTNQRTHLSPPPPPTLATTSLPSTIASPSSQPESTSQETNSQ
ncbi:hypothetical protein D915_004116 [Fasciola hepatica]|uniref:Uncharacterized protein n=1 Tax=Fasciola hepatica TaxID=6192 RepID=A0A4E0RCK8_FASHE|nr:hypothetical protein D915_004116 [Fasciola hepatica]